MSWKKTIAGDFAQVREQLDSLAEMIRADQGVITEESDKSVIKSSDAHALQARIATDAVRALTAHHSAEETFTFDVSGDVGKSGGKLVIGYSFTAPKDK
jgi:hypothetical protein